MVLQAPLPDVHNAAVRLRGIDRGLGIVAIAAFPDAESRIRTLLCGADACLSPEVSGLELAAVLQALVRRAAGMDAEPGDIPANGEPPSDAWRLANKGWTLISPGGRTMGLTTESATSCRAWCTRRIARSAAMPSMPTARTTPTAASRAAASSTS